MAVQSANTLSAFCWLISKPRSQTQNEAARPANDAAGQHRDTLGAQRPPGRHSDTLATPHTGKFIARFRLSIGAGEGIRPLDPDLGKVVLRR